MFQEKKMSHRVESKTQWFRSDKDTKPAFGTGHLEVMGGLCRRVFMEGVNRWAAASMVMFLKEV